MIFYKEYVTGETVIWAKSFSQLCATKSLLPTSLGKQVRCNDTVIFLELIQRIGTGMTAFG